MFKKEIDGLSSFKVNEEPLRDEVFSPERLEEYAKFLASELPFTTDKKKGRNLFPRIKQNSKKLVKAYQRLIKAVTEKKDISPAGEWIIDNFHIIEEQIREIKEDLPEKYYVELPKISEGELTGLPRVYALTVALIAHSDSYMDFETLKKVIKSYQTVSPLLIGEIWAIPISARMGLVENLRRLATFTVISQEIKEKTDLLCDQLFKGNPSESQVASLLSDLGKMLGNSELEDSCIWAQISQRIHTRNPDHLYIYEKIDKYLAENNIDIEEMARKEHQIQSANLLSVSNCIYSLRLIGNVEWQDFFESVSLIDPVLAKDPLDSYSSMNFESRDKYRDAIERIHKRTGHGEIAIAKEAINLANKAHQENIWDIRKHHVGYYLIRNGVRELEKKIGYIATIGERVKRKVFDYPTFFYLGLLTIFTLLIIFGLILFPLVFIDLTLRDEIISAIILFLVSVVPASDSGLLLLNFFVTQFVGPFILPKINLENGIPDGAKTFVIIPSIINFKDAIPNLLEHLETCYLTNQSKNLYFAILSDFADADNEIEERDQEILTLLKTGIQNLNDKYCLDRPQDFFLFHRKRLWNESEGKWMGWERKRGKIQEFNQFLRGKKDLSFIVNPTFSEFFSDIKYVITLDTDTVLPRDNAKKLIGTILHPLNYPQIDKEKKMVVKGYSILQPRIGITPESAEKSLFAKIYSGHTGIDPYTTAVSNVYQDLFREGSYTGKGLYVVDAFETSLEGRIPENKILSHDLIEGAYARAALVSDIELYDAYPSHYSTFAKRHHRWIRGDWQILQWLFSKVPDANNNMVKNPLSTLSKWKIFDNLRRSLVAPSLLLWFAVTWFLSKNYSVFWTLLILVIMLIPITIRTASKFLKYPHTLSWIDHLRASGEDLLMNLTQLGIYIMALPYQTISHLDAIIRTLYRVFISKKNLLVWRTAAQEESALKKKSTFALSMILFSSVPAIATFFLIWFKFPFSLAASIILLAAWAISPLFFEKISKEIIEIPYKLGPTDKEFFRSIAFRTWHFFETFVTKEENWLPPDNFQADPAPMVASRTSPTNMGLYLLSSCSAYDFGFIGPNELLTRLEDSLGTLKKLKKRFGHFYNWYNTRTLETLFPEYISTVDSGNMAGHLLTVKQICVNLKNRGVLPKNLTNGISDTLKVLKNDLNHLPPAMVSCEGVPYKFLNTSLKDFINYVENSSPKSNEDWAQFLFEADKRLHGIKEIFDNLAREHGEDCYKGFISWVEKAERKIDNLKSELALTQKETFSAEFKNRCIQVSKVCHNMAMEMNFSILYNKNRKLFTIGYRVEDGKRDDSYYDLLASEARLTSFLSIAKGDIPQDHWFHLGRQMTSLFNKRILISWSASMFEYLMPLLVMKDYKGTLLNETYQASVKQQIKYAKLRRLPWGISESAYNARDIHMNYQYGPFGVPGLGLKRGLSHDYVISPYSTALASMVYPGKAIKNFKTLIENGLLTEYGFYEAVDYTQERIPPKEKSAVIKNFMAHHQGMSLVSLGNVLHKNLMQARFHQDPMIKATELLLQERIPQRVFILHPREEEVLEKGSSPHQNQDTLYQVKDINTEIPEVRVLSNGTYTTVLSSVGSGYSQYEGVSIFRWQEDGTLDQSGQFVFVREGDSLFPTTFQPMTKNPSEYRTTFSEHKVEFFCRRETITTHTEVIVSAKDNVELKRIHLTNLVGEEKALEVTSYAEPILSTVDADIAHPAFNKLFIQTEFIENKHALIARRGPRSESDQEYFGIHLIASDKEFSTPVEYETNRSEFIGRGNDLASADQKLTGAVGGVLDPIFSLRAKITLAPYESRQILFVSGIAKTHAEALGLIDQYHDIHVFGQEDQRSWTQSQINLKHLNIHVSDINTYQELAGALIYTNRNVRASAKYIKENKKSQESLWPYGISGDLPILLVEISDKFNLPLVKELLRAHEYLRVKNIRFDLVILSEETSTYHLETHNELLHQIKVSGGTALINQRGGIFLLRKDTTPPEDQTLIKSVAKVYLNADRGNLKKQVQMLLDPMPMERVEVPTLKSLEYKDIPLNIPQLEFDNGFGGFLDGGREYIIHLNKGENTPAPWINVMANEKSFGTLTSETGSSYTWSLNSRENRLTPWSNDTTSDPSGEQIYILDHESNACWSPTPNRSRDDKPYLIRHGQGYTTFEHNSFEIEQSLTIHVSMENEVKFCRLKLKNHSDKERTLSIVYYLEWVLGFHRSKTGSTVITEREGDHNLFYATNPFLPDFGSRISFAATNKKISSFTCDRRSFLGRNGNYQRPLGLNVEDLDGAMGTSLDPCLAMKIDLTLKPGEEYEVIFIMGQDDSKERINELAEKALIPINAENELNAAKEFWDKVTSKLTIKTPYPEIDIYVNRWALYQTLSCRIWARTAFYQSGGAYGFRDQLQDCACLMDAKPELCRSYILRAAAHQFPEGDVLHWWHPPSDKGVRTRFSDDLLWLPFITNYYMTITGDVSILDEQVTFLEGPQLEDGVDDLYLHAGITEETADLYTHCCLTIDRSLKVGRNGLPLMGSGDWNDGMSEVGNKGEGESVWMGWFLGSTISSFIPICEKRGDSERVEKYQKHLEHLKQALADTGWDGKWFRRAYFDDGQPLGSSESDECKIDSIAQSWSVLSKLGSPEQTKQALESAKEHLIKNDHKMALLFTPAFDKTPLNPGYIKSYLPGVRENGGQYTHAACWLSMAFAQAGDNEQALELMRMLTPISHSLNREEALLYRAEPYAIVADIYSNPSHMGRGGWSWYTGSSGLYYRAVIEDLLGIKIMGDKIHLKPALSKEFSQYEFSYRYKSSTYNFKVSKTGKPGLYIDDQLISSNLELSLKDESKTFEVRVEV
jgi:cellobiose phosphorylase